MGSDICDKNEKKHERNNSVSMCYKAPTVRMKEPDMERADKPTGNSHDIVDVAI